MSTGPPGALAGGFRILIHSMYSMYHYRALFESMLTLFVSVIVSLSYRPLVWSH